MDEVAEQSNVKCDNPIIESYRSELLDILEFKVNLSKIEHSASLEVSKLSDLMSNNYYYSGDRYTISQFLLDTQKINGLDSETVSFLESLVKHFEYCDTDKIMTLVDPQSSIHSFIEELLDYPFKDFKANYKSKIEKYLQNINKTLSNVTDISIKVSNQADVIAKHIVKELCLDDVLNIDSIEVRMQRSEHRNCLSIVNENDTFGISVHNDGFVYSVCKKEPSSYRRGYAHDNCALICNILISTLGCGEVNNYNGKLVYETTDLDKARQFFRVDQTKLDEIATTMRFGNALKLNEKGFDVKLDEGHLPSDAAQAINTLTSYGIDTRDLVLSIREVHNKRYETYLELIKGIREELTKQD